MPESIVQVTSGAGPKLHTFQRTIGANTVEDELVLLGLPYHATYTAIPGAGVSAATAASHIFQVMAGAVLNVYIIRIVLYQVAIATAAAIDLIEIVRLSTAGTGGTVVTPAPRDTTDAASGATSMTLPTVKGTETIFVDRATAQFTQTIATQSGGGDATILARWDYAGNLGKALRIAAGAANGIAIKNPTARAAATVLPVVTFIELNH